MDNLDRGSNRRTLPINVFRLGEEPVDDLAPSTTAAERFEMVALLTARMMELSARPQSGPERRGHPLRVLRR
jgi:hypothetical protein